MPSEKRASCFRRCCWPRSWPPRSRRRPCFCPATARTRRRNLAGDPAGSGWPCSVRWCWPRSRRPSCGRSAHRSTTWWRAWPVRSQGRLPAHAEDQRADQMVGSPACQLGGVHACAVRLHRHRSRADQSHPAERPAARGPAAVPHARHGRGPRQQLGRAPGPLPAELRDRRRTEYRRDRRAFAAGVATGGIVAVLGVAIAAVALLFTGHHPVQTPNLVGPAQASQAPASPSRSPSASPSASSFTSPSATSTPSPSPSVSPTASPTPSSSAVPSATPSPTVTPTPTTSPTAP